MSTQQRVNRIKSRQESLKPKCQTSIRSSTFECGGLGEARVIHIKNLPREVQESFENTMSAFSHHMKTPNPEAHQHFHHTSKKVLSFSQYVNEVKEAENELELYFIMKQFQENENRFNEKQIFFIKEQFEEKNHELEVKAVKNRM